MIAFNLNGHDIEITTGAGRTLLSILRQDLDLTGTKQGCDNEGECGACTVLLDGEAVRSCLLPVEKVAGRRVTTIEGIGTADRFHPVQQAFVEHGAVQCGFCTPGMILSTVALLERELNPTREQIGEALEGNLCRCTGYIKIIEAVEAAAASMRGESLPRQTERAHVIGGSQLRVDAAEKVTGSARYAEDIKLPGLLHAVLVRSPHPHARVVAIDPQPTTRLPGVSKVLTATDIPGDNSLEGYSRNEYLLIPVGHRARMVGDAVAMVLGESPESARAGAAAVRVEYETLPHTYDGIEAMAPDAPVLETGGNVLSEREIKYGDLEEVMLTSDLVLEQQYQTPFMEHAALERETVLSYLDGEGRVTIVAGHQEPHWARGWTASMLGLPEEQVRVITPPTGGAFGGKQDPWPLMAGALAAYHAPQGRPVRLTYTRRESFDASPKRHPYQLDYQVGAKSDGRLTGLHLRIVANTGAYDCDGYYIPGFALVAGGGPYRWQAVDARAFAILTNGPKAGQMRGFGTPQAAFALECALDEVAVRLGVDPLELRLKNAIDDDEWTFLGYPLAETFAYRQCLETIEPHYRAALARVQDLNRAGKSEPWRRGVGLAGMWYRFGKRDPITCEAHAELGQDGTISCYFSAPDYGQGTTTVMAQLAAEALGVARDSLCMVNADTARTPDSGIQGASRSTYWVGGAVAQAARELKGRILGTASEILDCAPDGLHIAAEAVLTPGGAAVSLTDVAAEMDRIEQPRTVRGVFAPQLGPEYQKGDRPEYLPFFVSGTHLAEIRVHTETGQVQVEHVVAVHDVGRVVNPQSIQGQVEGAIAMSLGAALMEEYHAGTSTGLSDYYLPTIRSTPKIDIILVEVSSRWGPLGAKGIGEGAILPTAPAIVNGIYHATGARIRRLPATPERVLAALG